MVATLDDARSLVEERMLSRAQLATAALMLLAGGEGELAALLTELAEEQVGDTELAELLEDHHDSED
jgi:hypothetical protein